MNRCTKAVLYQDNLRYNLKNIKKYIGNNVKMCVAVKADAYGHNAVLTAKIAQECSVEYLAVATVEEGIELRNNGITAKILLLSLCTNEEMTDLIKNKIIPLVYSFEHIGMLKKACTTLQQQKYPVFLAIDTGMGRIGCLPKDAGKEALYIEENEILKLEGMCTHFSVSDSQKKENIEYTEKQFEAFKLAIENVKKSGINPGICSCANSAALLCNPKMHLDMVRPGIITYGYYPDKDVKEFINSRNIDFDIKPVLAFETKVASIRHFNQGKSISYGREWICDDDTDIAVLPVGYADGLLRRFSPGLYVTINGENYPIRGRICMDQCMVDIGKNNDKVKLWDKAIIFGPEESGALNTADTLAEIGNTISYEVLTSLSKRVKREIL
ncbi:MAG: alanine racemase [Spirochaetales bacterium]|nr:alanine racemase [Spirochaetales bacterium]MDY5915712.1 alanine racemase [Treponema sp.]